MPIKFAVIVWRKVCMVFSKSDDLALHSRPQLHLKLDTRLTCSIIVISWTIFKLWHWNVVAWRWTYAEHICWCSFWWPWPWYKVTVDWQRKMIFKLWHSNRMMVDLCMTYMPMFVSMTFTLSLTLKTFVRLVDSKVSQWIMKSDFFQCLSLR